MSTSPLPKLSYVLLSHNRETYIRQAIESAFAQDYEGELEYIFSDDCSTDRTFEIIKECVAAYKGNRRVVVTQTPKNLHLAGNTNHAVQFVTSDWIVRADDDDLSAVNRCSLIGNAIAAHPHARYITTGVIHFIDSEEQIILSKSKIISYSQYQFEETDVRIKPRDNALFKPANKSYKAWHMDVFRKFGALPIQGYYVDDLTCFYRASILGTGVHVNHFIGVFVRDGSGNMCRGGDDNQQGYNSIVRLEKFHDKYYNITLSPMRELQQALINYTQQNYILNAAPFLEHLNADIKERELLCSFWRKGSFNRIRISRKLGYSGIFAALRCLPLPLFAFLLALYRKLFKNRK